MADTVVKICGLQSVEVLKSMINLSIDYVGFVFARSKRQVTGSQVAELVPVLKEWKSGSIPQSVGVFVNPTLEELTNVLQEVQLDVVQLHGLESPQFCNQARDLFQIKVFKAFSVRADDAGNVENLLHEYDGSVDGILVDAYDPHYGGGAGVTFPWDLAIPYQAWANDQGIPFLVAGGLHSDNVQLLIETVAPHGVDVSSGVERDGMKDITKITAFVERVRGK